MPRCCVTIDEPGTGNVVVYVEVNDSDSLAGTNAAHLAALAAYQAAKGQPAPSNSVVTTYEFTVPPPLTRALT